MTSVNSSVTGWVQFFKDAGIPAGLGAKYAVIFSDHRITHDLLGDLTRDILADMGIKIMGDIIAILKQAKIVTEQLNREKTTKLLRGNSSSPIQSQSTSSTEARSNSTPQKTEPIKPKEKNQEKPTTTSVFKRLGEDSPVTETTGVFRRLGEPVVTTTNKTDATEIKIIKKSEKKQITSTKRKSALERLGPEKVAKKPEETTTKTVKKTVVARTPPKASKKVILKVGKKPVSSPEVSDGDSTSPESVAKTKPVVKFRASSLASRNLPKQKFVVKQRVTSARTTGKKSDVMARLGAKVTSTTPSPDSDASVKLIRNTLASRQKATSPKYSRLRLGAPLGSGGMKSKPISSNKVSSTTSAGIFRGGSSAVESGSVFNRLGKK
uniref:Uncharacterized protein C19orf47 homolog n=1 Tax=Phallusia mammillata TaxID=59560 RepID=A0A6F9D7S9_9ASCI|nr:uncharacterized protein C19orf47 homolog [Phallusia mammillata]